MTSLKPCEAVRKAVWRMNDDYEGSGYQMSDNEKPKLGLSVPLGVRRTVETGKVKQSF
jgi:hypothetical protein